MVNCNECTRMCKEDGTKRKDASGNCVFFKAITDFLDHTALLSWFGYCCHKAANTPGKNVNFDNREKIILPSGKCVKITLIVESLGMIGVDYEYD